jgi:uncharacterized protein (DUF1015 family)
MKLLPFNAWHPRQEFVSRVASPPYDVIGLGEARDLARRNPDSFIRVVRADADLPPGEEGDVEAATRRAARNLDRLKRDGLLVRDSGPGLYLYAQTADQHTQTGLVALCPCEAYEQGLIKIHEHTLDAKVADRVRHMDACGAHTGPVFLAYRGRADIDALTARVASAEPFLSFTADDGILHRAWRIPDPALWKEAFESIPCAYVADGHHRSEAAVQVGRLRRERNPHHDGTEEYNGLLCVLFPAADLRICAYNRGVRDLGGLSAPDFLDRIRERFEVTPVPSYEPPPRGRALLYVDRGWHALSWEPPTGGPPTERLDVHILQERLLGPVLGIENPRRDPRLEFAGGKGSPERLRRAVDEGSLAAAICLCAVSMEDIMDVADAGGVMPPKSTWFEPKLRSGLFVHDL